MAITAPSSADLESFFLAVAIGMEEDLSSEFELKWPLFKKEMNELFPWEGEVQKKFFKGGMELTLPYIWGLCLNFYLRIPTRILLRIDQFSVRDFPKLYQKLKKVSWRPYLTKGPCEVSVTCHESRLIHSQKVKLTFLAALEDLQKGQPFADPKLLPGYEANPPSIFLRLDNDLCTVSVDTSGDRLHKRAYRVRGSRASIRENLAAALLWRMWRELPAAKKERPVTLVDALCGSGTFLFEARHFFAKNQDRAYAFYHFPRSFKYLSQLGKLPDLKSVGLFKNYFGLDQSPEALKLALDILQESFAPDQASFRFEQQDAFVALKKAHPQEVVVLSNPPYGKRLARNKVSLFYYEELMRTLCVTWEPLLLGILVPLPFAQQKAQIPPGYTWAQKFFFKNSGLDVGLWLLKKSI